MPSYHDHRSNALPLAAGAAILTLVISIDSKVPFTTSLIYSVTAFVLIIAGVALPDVDHHASIPRQKAGALTAFIILLAYILGVTVVTDFVAKYFDNILLGIVIMGILTYVGLAVIPPFLRAVGRLFDSLISHRGFTHSIMFAFVVAAILYYVLERISIIGDSLLPVIAGSAIFIGIVKHFSDDGAN